MNHSGNRQRWCCIIRRLSLGGCEVFRGGREMARKADTLTHKAI